MHSQTCVWFKKDVWLAVTNLHVYWISLLNLHFQFGSPRILQYVGTCDCPMV